MNTKFETNFTVMPEHTNALSPMIFGGAFFSEMDLCAANAVKRFLYDSPTCDTAVTHKFNGSYLKPCYLGDLIKLNAEITDTGSKSICVNVRAWRETKEGDELVADTDFVFVSIKDKHVSKGSRLNYAPHLLEYNG